MVWRCSEGEQRFHVLKSVSLTISFLLFVPVSRMSWDFAPLPLQNRRRNRVQVWGVGAKVSTRVPGYVGSGRTALEPPGLSQAVQQDSSSLIVLWELSLVLTAGPRAAWSRAGAVLHRALQFLCCHLTSVGPGARSWAWQVMAQQVLWPRAGACPASPCR